MKARYYPALVAAALVCNLQPACSQETVEAPAPPPPGHPAIAPLPPFDPLDHLENVGKHLLRIPRMIHDELRPLDHIKMLLAQVPTPPGAPQIDPVAIAHGAIASAGDFLPFKWSGSSKAGRALLIPKDDADPEAFANAEEDLNIMALILEKAVAQQSDDDHKKVMGIDMLFGGNSSSPRSLLIEGYGAVFMLRTKLALTPPPKPKTETKPKESATSEWDDVRRELYGPSEWDREYREFSKAFKGIPGFGSSSEEYDEQKVEQLKGAVVEALKNAANIRHLKGDNTVTVVVTGSVSGPTGFVSRRDENKNDSRRVEVRREARSDNSRGSVMLVQAKKSDIDAFAKDNNQDQFKKKVKIRVY